MNELYKKWFVIRTGNLLHPRQRSTTCAISEVTKCHLNVIDEQVNVYSAGTNF